MGHRRRPQQVRSLERYDAVTTNEIAARSEMAVGSLYQYFANKDAIAGALAQRYLEAWREMADHVVGVDVSGLVTRVAIQQLVTPLIHFHASRPAFTHMWLGADVSPRLAGIIGDLDGEMKDRVAALIAARIPAMRPERAEIAAATMQVALKALLKLLGGDGDSKFKARVTREFREMFTAYVESMIVEHESGTGAQPPDA